MTAKTGNCSTCDHFMPFPATACKLRVTDTNAECAWKARKCWKTYVEEKRQKKGK